MLTLAIVGGLKQYFAGPGIAWLGNDNDYGLNGDTDLIRIRNITNCPSLNVMNNGIYAGYNLLDNHLWVGAGLALDTAWIKKGAYGPFNAGVNYSGDMFSVGAHWTGQFGYFNGSTTATETNHTDKKYSNHTFYVGAGLNFLKDAKVGTTFSVGFAFNTEKASTIKDTKKNTVFAGTVQAALDFRNNISDTIAFTVGYDQYNGKKSKVLPLYIGNTLKYSVSDGASFSLFTAYEQGALSDKKKSYTDGVTNGYEGALGTKAKYNDANFADMNNLGSTANPFACEIVVKPSFSWRNGPHSFSLGVQTNVFNDIQYFKKTDTDWAYSAIKGIWARVEIPMSWTYNF